LYLEGDGQMSRIQRIVGFDCGEDTHSAVLLDTAGKFCRKSEVTNERGRIQEVLAELMLVIGPEAELMGATLSIHSIVASWA